MAPEPSSTTGTTASEHLPPGIIYPPPEIKLIVEKTAGYVAKQGAQFEDRIREKEKTNPKFCFLNPVDPYRPYYDFKLKQIREGKGKENHVDKQLGAAETKSKEAESATPSEPLAPIRVAPPEPPKYEYLMDLPGISAQDLDVVKLTAQFAAANGRSFISALAQKEARNYQFDFLKPTHSLYSFFMKLVDQYSKILVPHRNLISNLKKVLDRIDHRVEYRKYHLDEKKKQEEEAEEERVAFARIDWHEFVILDTIEFVEADDMVELPPPVSLIELQTMSLTQKKANLAPPPPPTAILPHQEPQDIEMEEDMDMEMDEPMPDTKRQRVQ